MESPAEMVQYCGSPHLCTLKKCQVNGCILNNPPMLDILIKKYWDKMEELELGPFKSNGVMGISPFASNDLPGIKRQKLIKRPPKSVKPPSTEINFKKKLSQLEKSYLNTINTKGYE